MKKALLFITSMLTGTMSMAQTVAVNAVQPQNNSTNTDTLLLIAIWVVIAVSILVLIVAIYALTVIRTVLLEENVVKTTETEADKSMQENLWNKLFKSLTKATPVAEESSIMFEHSYDGIRELDNHLPPWWKWLFFISIGWSAFYLLAFHVFNVFPLSGEEYSRQMTRAEVQLTERKATMVESIDETNVVFSNDPAIIDNGKAIFAKYCIPCHAIDGGGGVGPNFTDRYWLHGGRINDIFKTIKYGVPEKGMITWQTMLKPGEMRDVACYIQTLQGTTPAKPKEPQGDLYQPDEKPSVKPDSAKQIMKNPV